MRSNNVIYNVSFMGVFRLFVYYGNIIVPSFFSFAIAHSHLLSFKLSSSSLSPSINIVILAFLDKLANGQQIQAVLLENVLTKPDGMLTDLREFAMNANEYGSASSVTIRQIGNVFIQISKDNVSLHGDRLMNLIRLGCHKKYADANPNAPPSGAFGQGSKLSLLYGIGGLFVTTTKITDAYGRLSFLITGKFCNEKGEVENQSCLIEFELSVLQNGDISAHYNNKLVSLAMIQDLNVVMRAIGMVDEGMMICFFSLFFDVYMHVVC